MIHSSIPNDRSIPLTSSMGMGPRGNGIYVSSQIYDDNPERIYMRGIGDFITDQRSSVYQIHVGDVVVFKTINSANILRFNVGLVENVSNGMVTFSTRQEINVGTMQELADGSVTEDKLADHAVTASKIALGAISGENIGHGTITGDNIGYGTITGGNMASGAVSTPYIHNGAIIEDKLADHAVTAPKIADNAVLASHIHDGAITENKLSPSITMVAISNDEIDEITIL